MLGENISLADVSIFPFIRQFAGVDPIWFGIFFVVLIETALITPPVGKSGLWPFLKPTPLF